MQSQKVAIVIGGGSGIGKICAFKLKESGYKVGILSPRNAEITANEIGGLGLKGSILIQSDIENFISKVNQQLGAIQVVISSTGHVAKGELLALTESDWHLGLDLLLLNIIKVSKLVIPQMINQNIGSFVNISSFAAKNPNAEFPISSVIRAALSNFTKMFAKQYAKFGIKMNNVLPGIVDNFTIPNQMVERLPMGRPANLEDIANMVTFLASEKASYITGQDFLVDGGLCLSS